jgi:hypothetical protein
MYGAETNGREENLILSVISILVLLVIVYHGSIPAVQPYGLIIKKLSLHNPFY